MKVTGKIIDGSAGMLNEKPVLKLEINEKHAFMSGYDTLAQKQKLQIEIKPYHKRRSLDANAYAWVLIDKLAEEMGLGKEEVYRHAIENIGGNTDVVCLVDAAVDKVCRNWGRNGLGWMTERFPSKIPGCTNVVLYYGSSTFDTKQMSKLIDYLIQDCKAVGIETMPPNELKKLLEAWDGEEERKGNGEKHTSN